MSEKEESRGRRQRRSTAKRGTLRRFNSVETAVVEDTFTLSLPSEASAAVRNEVSSMNVDEHVGDGCYISATVHNRRYYGVLIDQAALKAASMLHFQDESNSLDLNRRMKLLRKDQPETEKASPDSDEATAENLDATLKRTVPEGGTESSAKRAKLDDSLRESSSVPARPIQKFRYVDDNGPGYRLLCATYADIEAASEDDSAKAKMVENACQEGGGFVGNYYYQYQVGNTALQASEKPNRSNLGLHMSMGFDSFLQRTALPVWFPLSNLETGGQHKVLSMLQMKRNNKGGIEWDATAETTADAPQGTLIPMSDSRTRYRVGILGGGISGLACATELIKLGERENMDLEIILLEGRSRLGGRIFTDEETFVTKENANFPVDLGASWIHGVDHNPLASLAKESGAEFVTASEEVKMLTKNKAQVDTEIDEATGKLFDDLLDQAAEDCWEGEDYVADDLRDQNAVRWYAANIGRKIPSAQHYRVPIATDAPRHRHSSDVAMDRAIGDVVSKHKRQEFEQLSQEEKNLLFWNCKNIEYALGANCSDLSMKFWDSDDRHAFEGDHVLLKQGYSSVIHYMARRLEEKTDKFQIVKNFQIGKIEYARRSTSQPLRRGQNSQKFVDISDSCCVTSKSGEKSFKFDFLVCTLPLGVLKASIQEGPPCTDAVDFHPPLPFPKKDAITNVGYGILNKIYIQFASPFWREKGILDEGQTLFGNASGLNPQYYMFFDVGRSLGNEEDAPAVLMTLVSGKEAVDIECKSDKDVVDDILATLRLIFTETMVSDPLSFRVTRWGSDLFARGCYTFLPPGATDQDFQILQSPINGNGDSLLLEGSETMRLFFAGEHTTSLHPSTAHGALLSGIRAAKEVIDTMSFRYLSRFSGTDKLIPMAIFRDKNPDSTLQCSLCHLPGSRMREGSLLAFQRGARRALVHNNCAEFSPEVEVRDGIWKDVIKAVNRGSKLICTLCGQLGATAGCTHEKCFRSYHFCCAEDTGWRFERDGKEYYCDLHRDAEDEHGQPLYGLECDRVSMHFFRTKRPTALLKCIFCGIHGLDKERGKLLAFQQRKQLILSHENCARFTNVINTIEESEMGEKFRNIFDALRLSKNCCRCLEKGGTITCSDSSCDRYFHFACCVSTGWDFKAQGRNFRCEMHRVDVDKRPAAELASDNGGGLFQHNLFTIGASSLQDASDGSTSRSTSQPSNHFGVTNLHQHAAFHPRFGTEDSSTGGVDDEEKKDNSLEQQLNAVGSGENAKCTIRRSVDGPWNLSLRVFQLEGARTGLSVEWGADPHNEHVALLHGDIITSMNGTKVGSSGLFNAIDVLALLKRETEITLGLCREAESSTKTDLSN